MKSASVRYRAPVEAFSDYPMHYIEVPEKIVARLGGKFRARLLCTLGGAPAFHCGLNPLGEGRGYITLSRQRLQDLGLRAGDFVAVELKLDTSKYGMAVPPEFREVLKQDPEAGKRFKALKPGKQRTLLHHVGGAKSVDLRIERSLRLMENLKRLPQGKETIPALFGRAPKAGSGRW